MKSDATDRMLTGIENLDALLEGGLPHASVVLIGGSPGAGKTILSQQIAFHNATPEKPVVFFNTLSEPAPKTLKYLRAFRFFDEKKMNKCIRFIDLGDITRSKGLEQAGDLIMAHLKKIKPAIVVIDSFKVFADLAESKENLRKFTYKIAVNLAAWECAAFLLGEFTTEEVQRNPLSSIVDGIMMLTAQEVSGEEQRFIQILKMRGTAHSRDKHALLISDEGISVYAPRVSIRRDGQGRGPENLSRRHTGIPDLDKLLGKGIPEGSTLLLSGTAGTGKTILCLETLYRGAKDFNEKGIYFTFEETADRLIAAAHELGFDLKREIKRGMIEIVSIPQPDILVEADLAMIKERIERMRAKRVIIDSVSVFLHKIKDPKAARENVFQLAALVARAQALGIFVTHIPYGTSQISRFGVEETVADGIILLASALEGARRHRSLEVYKLRNGNHTAGPHPFTITPGGIRIQGQ